MSNPTAIQSPVIFIGAPRSGVTLLSDILFHHKDLCWLDAHFDKHPNSDLRHHAFKITSSLRSHAPTFNNIKRTLAEELSPVPSEATNFWHNNTREEIDFYRGFLRGKHATPGEMTALKTPLERRMAIAGKANLGLRFTGPGRICFLQSIFPKAKFVNVVRDPASTVHSILSTEEWEYQGKHLLWWRGAYSLQELAMYDQLRAHPVAGTAFQLNKLIQTTKQEAEEVGAHMLTVNYEDFATSPSLVLNKILDFAQLPTSESINAVLGSREFRCSNKVLKMPATDINTVYTWCPAA